MPGPRLCRYCSAVVFPLPLSVSPLTDPGPGFKCFSCIGKPRPSGPEVSRVHGHGLFFPMDINPWSSAHSRHCNSHPSSVALSISLCRHGGLVDYELRGPGSPPNQSPGTSGLLFEYLTRYLYTVLAANINTPRIKHSQVSFPQLCSHDGRQNQRCHGRVRLAGQWA